MDSTPTLVVESPFAFACQRLYQAEQALHDARSSHVDSWIAAACDRLHAAVQAYTAAAALEHSA